MANLKNKPLLSIIIPCRNEEKFIAQCIESISEQTFPKDGLEVLIIDGMSQDKTRQIITEYQKRFPFIELIDNPQIYPSFALNIGIKKAQGDIILRMDVHAKYKSNYAQKCVKYLREYKADNVGGILKIMPQNNGLQAKTIALVSSSFFGAGDAYYRRGYNKGIKWVNTVFCGCYRKKIFDKIGLFNEKMVRNQDLEFNLRLKKAGGKILLSPEIIAYYYPKATFIDFFKHNFKDGFWVVYPLKYGIKAFSWRHILPMSALMIFLAIASLAIVAPIFRYALYTLLSLYAVTSTIFSACIAAKGKNLLLLLTLPVTFFIRQFAYALGSLWALVNLPFKEKQIR